MGWMPVMKREVSLSEAKLHRDNEVIEKSTFCSPPWPPAANELPLQTDYNQVINHILFPMKMS